MTISLGSAHGKVRIDASGVDAAAKQSESGFKKIEEGFKKVGESMSSVGRDLSAKVTAPLVAVGGAAVATAAKFETIEVAFATMLGGAEAGKKALDDLFQFTASTPFQFEDVSAAGRTLLAFGQDANTLTDTLRSIGDISAGIGAPLGEIAEIYGKARVQGRLFMEDINQLTGRGIPIIQELAKQFGVAESEIRDLVSNGEVSFDNLEQAFNDLTSEGGQFAGLMEAQSQTVAGLFSTLKDQVVLSLGVIGNVIIDTFDLRGKLKDGIEVLSTLRDSLTNLAETRPDLLRIGVVFAAVLAAAGPVLVIVGQLISVIGTAAPVFKLLATVISGPVGIAIAILAGLITAIVNDIGGIRTSISSFIDDLIDKFGEIPIAGEFLDALSQILSGDFSGALDSAKTALSGIPDALQPVIDKVGEVVSFIQENWPLVQQTIINAIGTIVGFVQENWPLIQQIIETVLGDIQAVVESVTGFITGLWEQYGDDVVAAVTTATETIGELFSSLFGNLSTELAPVADEVVGIFNSIGDAFLEGGTIGAIQEFIDKWPEIQGVAEKAVAGVIAAIDSTFGTDIAGTLSSFGQLISDTVGKIQEVSDKAQEFGTKISDTLSPVFEGIASVMKVVAEEVGPSLVDIFNTVSESMSAFEPVGEQFKALFEELGPLFESFIGALSAIFEALKPLLEVIGVALVGVLLALVGLVVGLIQGIAEGLQPFIQTIANTISAIVGIATGLVQLLTSIFDAIIALFTGNGELLSESLEGMKEAVLEIFNNLVLGIVGLIVGLGITLGELIGGLVQGIIDFFTNLYDELVGNSIVPDMVTAIIDAITGLRDSLILLWEEVKTKASDTWVAIKDKIIEKWNEIKTFVDGKITEFKTAWNTFWQDVLDKVIEKWTEIKDTITEKLQEAKDAVDDLKDDFITAGENLIAGIKEGIVNKAGELITAVVSAVSDAIGAAKDWAGIESPSTRARDEVGEPLGQGTIEGVMNTANQMGEAMREVIESGFNAASELVRSIQPDTVTIPALAAVGQPSEARGGQPVIDTLDEGSFGQSSNINIERIELVLPNATNVTDISDEDLGELALRIGEFIRRRR